MFKLIINSWNDTIAVFDSHKNKMPKEEAKEECKECKNVK